MKESFVFTLSEYDTFRVVGSKRVNINDASEFLYTFWNPTVGLGKKQMYAKNSITSCVAGNFF
jgi:hypothetical protein